MIRFNLDKNVRLDFTEQIRGQLLSAIYCGKIREGDRLPSIRELCAGLGVNYKTIRRVYAALAEEGLIELVKGSGAFLKRRTGNDTFEQMRRSAILRLVRETSEKARSLGLSTEKFARLFLSHSTGEGLRPLRLAVIDHEEEAYIFSRELRMRLEAEVISVTLGDESGAREQLGSVDYLLTTSYHIAQISDLARALGKEIVEIQPNHQIYREILESARHRKTAVVIKDAKTMHASLDIFMSLYHPSTSQKFWIAPIDREDLIEEIVREAEVIFVSPMCWDELKWRTPSGRELKTYENFISEATIGLLKELQLVG